MEKKKYFTPQIEVLKVDGAELLDGVLASGPGKVVIPTDVSGIQTGNAGSAASKNHFNLWDYDIEDFEDDEDEKRNK